MQEKSKLRYIILIYIFHIEIQLYIETELFRSFKVHIFINKITTQVELCHVCIFRFVFNRLMICLTKRSLANHINQF